MHAQTQTHNPPLPYTRDAIIGNLQHHASNGPAYVQIQATTALARIMGLFNEAKEAIKGNLHRVSEEAMQRSRDLSTRITGLMSGELTPTAEELAELAVVSNNAENETKEEDDEPH